MSRYFGFAPFMALVAVGILSCGGSSWDYLPEGSHAASGFSLGVTDDTLAGGAQIRGFTLDVAETDGLAIVTVSARQAEGLKEAYLRLIYDTGKFYLAHAEPGEICGEKPHQVMTEFYDHGEASLFYGVKFDLTGRPGGHDGDGVVARFTFVAND